MSEIEDEKINEKIDKILGVCDGMLETECLSLLCNSIIGIIISTVKSDAENPKEFSDLVLNKAYRCCMKLVNAAIAQTMINEAIAKDVVDSVLDKISKQMH